jgi:hypothetical protein
LVQKKSDVHGVDTVKVIDDRLNLGFQRRGVVGQKECGLQPREGLPTGLFETGVIFDHGVSDPGVGDWRLQQLCNAGSTPVVDS